MSTYKILGQKITFSDSADRFCKMQFLSWKLSEKCESEFSTWYSNESNIENVLKNYVDKAKNLVRNDVIDEYYEFLSQYEIYDVSKDSFFNSCYNSSPIIDAFNKVAVLYNNINEEYNEEVAFREMRKEERSRWEGGGFGLGGAIKGAVTAGALNAASGLGHSIANSIGNASSKAEAENNLKGLYKQAKGVLTEAITSSVFDASNSFLNIVNKHKPGFIVSSFDNDQSNAYFENAKKVPAKEKELLIASFEKCPWNKDIYTYIFNSYEDERINIVNISKDFEIDMSSTIEDLFKSYVDDKSVFEDEAVAKKTRNKILQNMEQFDIKESHSLNILEQTWLLKLCENFETADESTCNQMKTKVSAYEALDSNKKIVLDRLQLRIEEIWSAEDNEIFDNYLLQADILDPKAVEEGIQYINSKGRTASKEVYLKAFQNISLSNIKMARKYNKNSNNNFGSIVFKFIGCLFILLAIMIFLIFDEPSWLLIILFLLIGIAYEGYVLYLNDIWETLTIKGTVIHDYIKADKKTFKQILTQHGLK